MLAKNCQKVEIELFPYGTILHENQTLSQIFFEWLCLKLNFFNMKDIPSTIIQFGKHNFGYEPQVKYNYMFSFDLFHVFIWFVSCCIYFLMIFIHKYFSICTWRYLSLYMHVYKYIYIYIYIYICVYIYIYTCCFYESWFVLACIKNFLKGPQVLLLLN